MADNWILQLDSSLKASDHPAPVQAGMVVFLAADLVTAAGLVGVRVGEASPSGDVKLGHRIRIKDRSPIHSAVRRLTARRTNSAATCQRRSHSLQRAILARPSEDR